MKALLACWKLARALLHALTGLYTIVVRFPVLSPSQRQDCVQRWALKMLAVLDIGLEIRGEPVAQGPALIVSNHISWLDILALHAGRYCRFVAKAEVRHWPLLGRLATGAGTLYIERDSRRDALRVVHHMADSLRAGDVLAVFPEGTTSDGQALLPFHANLLQAAIAADVPVQPVALRFIDAATRATSQGPSFTGDATLLGSLWRTLTSPRLIATVRYGVPQACRSRDRRTWAEELRKAVEALRQATD